MVDFSEADDTGGAPSPQLDAAAAAKRAAVAANAPKAQLSWMDQVGRFFWNPDGELENLLTRLPGAVTDLGVRGAGYTAAAAYRAMIPGATEATAQKVGAATRELVGGELERRQGTVPELPLHLEEAPVARAVEKPPVEPVKPETPPVAEKPPALPEPPSDALKPALAEANRSMRTMQAGADPNAPASVQSAGMAQHFSPQQAETRAAVEKMNRVGKPFGPPPGAPPRPPPGGPPRPPAAGMPPGGPPGGSRAFPGQRTFAPASMSPTTPYYGSRNVVAELAQERLGTADRITLQETNKLEEFRRPFNALHDGYGSDPNPPGTNAPTKADIVRRVQRVIKTPLSDPMLERGAQAIRDSNKGVERRFRNRPAYQHLNWIEDYFTGLWKATPERQAFLDAQRTKYGPGGKLGTGRFLKEKKLPTIDDALNAGLEPLYNDILDTVAHYQQSMNRHLAMGEIYDTLKDNGAIKWFFKDDRKAAGYAPMERGGPHNERQFIENDAGMRAHLPEDAARVWNNMVSLPWEAYHPAMGPYLNFIRRGQNLLTQATLAVPVYHALNETMTAVSNEFGRAIDNTLFAALKGETPQWKMGVKDMVYALGAPIHLAWTGKKLNTELARATDTSTRIGKIADLYARTRPNILNETVPWGSTGAGQNWWLPLQRGAAGNQLRGYKRELQDAAQSKILNFRRSPEGTWQLSPAANKALPVIGKVIGRTVDSVTHLFWNKWIPSLKRGAFYNAMNAFIERNPHATQAELDQAARAHAASMDDRFGQMQTDNLFWSKRLQDAMHLSFLSADWNTSFLRGFGGAASDVRKFLTSGADVKHLSTRVSYIIGWGLATALAGGVTTYMLTGRGPQSLKDLFYPPNGLKNEDGSEARIQLPGHLKDVTEAARVIRDPSRANIERLATGKVSPFAWLAYQTFMGTDWRGFRTNPTNETMSLIGRFFENVLSHVTPIPLQQAGMERKGQLGGAATMLGIRPAPFDVQEPEKAAMQEINSRFRDAVNKLRADTRYQQSLQNPKAYDSTIARDNRDVQTLAKQLQDAQDELSKSQRKNGYQGTVAPQQ